MTIDGGSNASRLCIGGIAGSLNAPMTIECCYVQGMTVTVSTTNLSDKTTYVGGIAGRTIGGEGTIRNCYTTNLSFDGVTHANNKAGILGSCGNTGYGAENCYTTYAKVQGDTSATNSYMGTTNCYNASTIVNATVADLGAAFKENRTIKNDGYPLLSWESTDGYDLKEEEEVEDPYFVGKGTEEEPFEIDTAQKLNTLAQLTNNTDTASYASKYYKLTTDIDMSSISSFKPISYAIEMYKAQGASFTGTFDGNNHVIKNVNMTSSIATYGATYGIIGYLGANGIVKNLGVENVAVDGGSNASRLCIGGITGSIGAGITIESCYVRGMTVTVAPTVTDKTTYVGGIAGRTISGEGTVKNCYTTKLSFDEVTYTNYIAGILGSCGDVSYKAENCYTTYVKVQGNVSATNSYMGEINCYSGTTVEFLKAETLGEAFDEDDELLNEGMPILVWEYDIAHPDTVYYSVKSANTEISDGDSNILVANPIVITFEREMNTQTFSKINILENDVIKSDCTFVPGTNSLTITITNAKYNTEYTVSIPKTVQSVRDENGKSAKADAKEITFRTEAMPEAVVVEDVKINGVASTSPSLTEGTPVEVVAEVENAGVLSSQPVALVVAVFDQNGVMKYAALDTGLIGSASETLRVQFEIPDNADNVAENLRVEVMIWDSITQMNAMR